MVFNLATLKKGAVQIPAIQIGKVCWPLVAAASAGFAGLNTDIKGLLSAWPVLFPEVQRFADACAAGQLSPEYAMPQHEAEFALPVQFPNKVVAIGANYLDHLAEMGAAISKTPHPVMFIKPPTTCLVGPGRVYLPENSKQFDWEVELAVVIGKRLRKAELREVMEAIAGYSVAVDFTARDQFFREDFYFKYDFLLGKGQDATTPLGPVIRPAAFVKDPHNLRIALSVNGKIKQDASTSGMIYRIDEQLSSISNFITLEPGDVVLTGSPAGVGLPRGEFLRLGDKVVAIADDIGELHIDIAREPHNNGPMTS